MYYSYGSQVETHEPAHYKSLAVGVSFMSQLFLKNLPTGDDVFCSLELMNVVNPLVKDSRFIAFGVTRVWGQVSYLWPSSKSATRHVLKYCNFLLNVF